MFQHVKRLRGYVAGATDGDIGQIEDFLFDDQMWTIRYLVVETGGFLQRAQVLISPISFESLDSSAKRLRLALSKQQVVDSPSIDTDQPVSRQRERELNRYYGYPFYWGASGIWGAGIYPGMLAPAPVIAPAREATWEDDGARAHDEDDVHLRSARHVGSYGVQGRDDSIGHIDDFLLDDRTWQIRYLVVSTRAWWFGKKVLLPRNLARRISWDERCVHVEPTRAAIKGAPEWQPGEPLNAAYERQLCRYYERAEVLTRER